MKNIISKINNRSKEELKKALTFNEEKTTKESFLNYAYYRELFTKKELQKIETLTFAQFKKELKVKITAREEKRKTEKINEVLNLSNKVFKILDIKIQVEWKKSSMWGANPTAEVWAYFINQDGNRECAYIKSRSVSGCGYDKLSTAISEALNEIDVLKANLYSVANQSKNKGKTNEQIFGYGSGGSSVLPRFDSGCGVGVYHSIFKAMKLNFQSTGSGKTFDIFNVTPLKK